MRATMDLIAAYSYDPSVLDLLELPEGVDRGVLIDNLLMETAEREIIYSNLGFLKQAIGSWSKKNLSVWEELYKTQHYEYNPIWNKDGTIEETITRDLAATEDVTTNVDREDKLTDKNTRNFEDKETKNYEDKETKDLDGFSTESVYGFNSSTAAPASKTDYEDNGYDTINHTGTDTFNHTGTDTVDHTGTQDVDTTVDRDTTDTGTISTTRTEQGNIGLTSTQDLIRQQQELVKFNLMDYIIKDFGDKFCLGIY